MSADRMIDLGFEEVVNAILDAIPTTNLKSEDEALALQQVKHLHLLLLLLFLLLLLLLLLWLLLILKNYILEYINIRIIRLQVNLHLFFLYFLINIS